MFNLVPSSDYRYALRKEDVGTDVAALQINLPKVTVDGVFGDQTEEAVIKFQKNQELLPYDGIAGPMTQGALVAQRCKPVQKAHGFPNGLLKSIASNESGLILAAAGPHNGDEGWDVGAFCRSSGEEYPTQDWLYLAYDVKKSANWTGQHLVSSKESLKYPAVSSQYLTNIAGEDQEKFSWQLAVLAHNWPVGARNIASKGSATSNDDAPAQWIIDATAGRLHTPREWCTDYIRRATVYVRW